MWQELQPLLHSRATNLCSVPRGGEACHSHGCVPGHHCQRPSNYKSRHRHTILVKTLLIWQFKYVNSGALSDPDRIHLMYLPLDSRRRSHFGTFRGVHLKSL